MVLTAGYGTRLGALTREVPKPMLDICGRPLLEYILVNLVRCRIREIALNLHFRPEAIEHYFGTGSSLGASITYSHESELLGTAGGVKKMAEFLKATDDFVVHYGDVITDQDLEAMHEFHLHHKGLATILLHRRERSNSVVALDTQQRIVRFLERPSEEERQGIGSSWTNSGIYICRRELLESIPAGRFCDFPRDIFPSLIDARELFGFFLNGFRCAVDSPQRLADARAAIREKRVSFDKINTTTQEEA